MNNKDPEQPIPTEVTLTCRYDGTNIKLTQARVLLNGGPSEGGSMIDLLHLHGDDRPPTVLVSGFMLNQKLHNRADALLDSLRAHLKAFAREGWLDRLGD
jgi:hypothetical protein